MTLRTSALLALALLAACTPPTGPAQSAAVERQRQAVSAPPAEVDRAEAESTVAAFREWLSVWQKAGAPVSGGLVDRGEALARTRRASMAWLLIDDPQNALGLALNPAERAALPAQVQAEIESWRDGRGMLHVIAATPLSDSDSAAPLDRFVSFDGDSTMLRAGVYGRRLTQPTREGLRLHGVELDGVIALSEAPLRQLFPGETIPELPRAAGGTCPVSKKAPRETSLWHGGDELFGFCVPEHVPQLINQLTSEEEEGDTQASSWTEGAKTLLFIRVDFSDNTGDPLSQAAAETLINTNSNNYFRSASYQKTSMSVTVTPTLRLPKTRAEYQANQSYTTLRADAIAAATAAGFPLANYNHDITAFRSTFSGWAGRGYVGSRGTWLNGSFGTGVTTHELGHNYGLYHANRWNAPNDSVIGTGTTVEYGNPFDVMGASGSGGHFGAWFKRRLDWIVPAEVQDVTVSGTHRVFALETPITTGLHGLRIPRGDGLKDYWVEFRSGFASNRHTNNGALVFWGYPSNQASNLLDTNPGGSANDSAVVIGRTFSDPLYGIHITPTGKGGTTPESLDVVVNLGTFPGNRAPTAAIAASATAVSTGQSVTFTATASDPDGDVLAYWFDFDDGTFSVDNQPTQAKSFSAARDYLVRLIVSDRKGATTTTAILVTVGAPTTFRLQGTVTASGQPLQGARITDGTRTTTSLSDGTWTLTNVPAGNFTVSATAFDYSFARSFAAPLAVAGSVAGLDFTGTPRAGYRITGRITASGQGLVGVTVSDGARTATTNANGDFTLNGVPNGVYPVTPSKAGWVFNPLLRNAEVYGADVTGLNFFTTGASLSGTVTGASAAPVITDGVRTATVSPSGANYTWFLQSVPNGAWNVVATAPGQTVLPSNFTNPVVVASASRNNLNFAASATTTFSVSGTVTTGGTPLPAVAVTDGTRTATTDSLGRYVLVGVPAGSHTLTPSHASYTFVPLTRAITVAAANLTGEDFSTTVVNAPPTIVTAAAASQTPTTLPTVTLSVLAADDTGEAQLTYTWSSSAFTPVTFSANGTNGAKSATVTFTRAGSYPFEVVVSDPGGLTVRSQITVQVTQVLQALTVTPPTATVLALGTQSFVRQGVDQFGQAMFPGTTVWAVSGGGTISTGGLFTAGATPGGPYTVTAEAGGRTATAFVSVVGAGAPTIVTAASATPNPVTGTTTQLSVLADDDAGEASLTYLWTTPIMAAPVTYSANGGNTAKASTATFTMAGDYQFLVTVTDTAGNSVSSVVNVTVEATPTRLEVQPAAVAVQVGQTQTFTTSVSDQFGDAIAAPPSIAFAAAGGGTIDGAGLFTADTTPGGPFAITATGGGVSGTAQVTITLGPDVTAPLVVLTAPADGARLWGAVTLTADATDDIGVTQVEFLSDGVVVGSATSAPWELALDAVTLGEGAHTLVARASDGAGNTADSAPVAITVAQDGTTPVDPPPTPPGPGLEKAVGGCGCSSGVEAPFAASWLLLGLGALARRRRRR